MTNSVELSERYAILATISPAFELTRTHTVFGSYADLGCVQKGFLFDGVLNIFSQTPIRFHDRLGFV